MPRPDPKRGAAAYQAVQGVLDAYRIRMSDKSFQGAEKALVDALELVRVEPDNTIIFSLFLGPQFQHIGNSLHGGAASLILDQCTSFAISPHSAPGYWEFNGGVTRTMAMTCLRAAPANTTVHVRCKVVSIGQTAVLVRGEIISVDGKTVYNAMDHNKMNVVLRKPQAAATRGNL